MKIALCFYGLVGSKLGKNGSGETLDPQIAYEHYKKHILDKNSEVDVFIHSWSVESRERLIELYQPKKECIEKQIDFLEAAKKTFAKKNNLNNKLKNVLYWFFNKSAYERMNDEKIKEICRAYSRWYSSKRVLDIKKDYENEKNFKYDFVMATRLDVAFYSDVIFDDYDGEYFYASHRNCAATKDNNYQSDHSNTDEGNTFLDLWFFSNSQNMDKFSLLYDEVENYDISPHRSSRQHVDRVIGKENVKYTLYRWFDHEMIRRKLFSSTE